MAGDSLFPEEEEEILKVLSIQQPFATLCCVCKDVENREWNNPSDYRGHLLIHSASRWAPGKMEDWLTPEQWKKVPGWLKEQIENRKLPRGAIVGEVFLEEIITDSPSVWAEEGQKHLIFTHPQLYPKPIRGIKGSKGIWNYSRE